MGMRRPRTRFAGRSSGCDSDISPDRRSRPRGDLRPRWPRRDMPTMKYMRTARELVALGCRAGAGAVLLWAGVAKALDRQATTLAVNGYDVLPAGLVRPVATALPWLEI